MPLTFYSVLLSFYHIYNFTPVMEYSLVPPDEEKHRWGFISHQKILNTKQAKDTFMTKPSKSLYHKLQYNIQSYTDIKSKIIRWQNLLLSLDENINGRPFLPTNSWRALKQRLLRTPELALVFLAGTRCSKLDTSLQTQY